jgi:hypothetical protein
LKFNLFILKKENFLVFKFYLKNQLRIMLFKCTIVNGKIQFMQVKHFFDSPLYFLKFLR